MQIELSNDVVKVLQEHLDDWNDLCKTNSKLTPKCVSYLIANVIKEHGSECNLFEDHGPADRGDH